MQVIQYRERRCIGAEKHTMVKLCPVGDSQEIYVFVRKKRETSEKFPQSRFWHSSLRAFKDDPNLFVLCR